MPRVSVAALVEISRGSPLVATQATLLLTEGGALPSSPGRPGRVLTPSGPDDVLEGIVDARLRRLSGRCRKPLAKQALVLASQVRWPEGVAEARLLLEQAA